MAVWARRYIDSYWFVVDDGVRRIVRSLPITEGTTSVIVDNLVSQVPHLLLVQLLGGLHIVDLWLEHIGTGLREMLEAGQQAQVQIVGPASVVSRLGVRAEAFDLNGWTANALKAEEFLRISPTITRSGPGRKHAEIYMR